MLKLRSVVLLTGWYSAASMQPSPFHWPFWLSFFGWNVRWRVRRTLKSFCIDEAEIVVCKGIAAEGEEVFGETVAGEFVVDEGVAQIVCVGIRSGGRWPLKTG